MSDTITERKAVISFTATGTVGINVDNGATNEQIEAGLKAGMLETFADNFDVADRESVYSHFFDVVVTVNDA